MTTGVRQNKSKGNFHFSKRPIAFIYRRRDWELHIAKTEWSEGMKINEVERTSQIHLNYIYSTGILKISLGGLIYHPSPWPKAQQMNCYLVSSLGCYPCGCILYSNEERYIAHNKVAFTLSNTIKKASTFQALSHQSARSDICQQHRWSVTVQVCQ